MVDDGKVGDYEVLSSLRIGMRTVFLCENDKAPEGQQYGCGFAERDDLFERYSDVEVSDNYMEIIKLYSARINDEVQAMEAELSELDVPLTIIGKDECYPNDYKESIKGKVVAIRADILLPEYQRADRQIYFVTGGFGAESNARGRAVYCTNIHTGKETRYNREDVQGVIKPECMPEWANNRLLIIQQDKSVFEYDGKHYIPFRLLTKAESGFNYVSRNVRSENSPNGYRHSDFYSKSTDKKCDLFLCLENNKLYLPGENELFAWDGERGIKDQAKKNKNKDYER